MPSPSPYFSYPVQAPRYTSSWSGQPGATLPNYRSASARELGSGDILESEAVGDGPLLRPAGPEPVEGCGCPLGFFDGMSNNERTVALFTAAGAAFYFWSRRRRKGRGR